MNIVIITTLNPYFQNGASANRWRSLIDGLIVYRNVRIHIFFTEGYNCYHEFKILGFKGNVNAYSYQYLSPLFNGNLWLRRINKYILGPIVRKYNRLSILRLIRSKQPDIVWTDSDNECFHLAVRIKKKRIKTKLMLELSEYLDIHQFDKGNRLIKKLGDARQAYFERKAFYAYDFILLMTKNLFNYYSSFSGPLPLLLHLPMTVDLRRFDIKNNTIPLREDMLKPYIIFVGVMNNAKDGVNILIDAFAKIHKVFPKLYLYLYGFYHYDSPSHFNQIKTLGLENFVYYKGVASRDEIPNLLMNAELLVLPRPDSKQAHGGFPTKLGEYLATGNPVCVTNVGEIQDYLENEVNAFIASPGSIESFADSMDRALSNHELAKKVGQNGRRIAEQYFNMDIQAESLYSFLLQNIKLEENKN